MRICISCIVLFAFVAVGPVSAGDNLVVNGTFDIDLADWNTGDGLQAWFPEDATGGSSGSAKLTNVHPGADIAQTPLLQCVVVDPGRYLFRAAMRIPTGQSTTGEAYLIAYAYGDSVCSGAPVAGSFSTTPLISNLWTTEGIVIEVPPGGGSVSIRTQVLKYDAGGTFDALFDDVELISIVFQDGFETGDTTRWSSATP